MINCLCPECSELYSARSSDFGELITCLNCDCRYLLDTEHLAHFTLPERLTVFLKDQLGQSVQIPNVVVSVEYGYNIPPLQTDGNGRLIVSKDVFEKTEQDEMSSGLQDHKGDYSLNRYIRVAVLTPAELKHMAKARKAGGWPILEFEKELYASLRAMLEVLRHNNNSEVNPAHTLIDLHNQEDSVTVDLVVR